MFTANAPSAFGYWRTQNIHVAYAHIDIYEIIVVSLNILNVSAGLYYNMQSFRSYDSSHKDSDLI